MSYRRALLVVDLGGDIQPAVSMLRGLAPRLDHLLVVLAAEGVGSWWSRNSPPSGADPVLRASLADLRRASERAALEVDLQVAEELGGDVIEALCAAEGIDLLVFVSRARMSATVGRRRTPIAVLCADAEVARAPTDGITCVVSGERSLAAMAAFLRDHSDRSTRVALWSPAPLAAELVATIRSVAGIVAALEIASPPQPRALAEWLVERASARPTELLAFVRLPDAGLLAALARVPVLVVPSTAVARPARRRPIDVPDLVDDGGVLRLRVDQVSAIGGLAPAEDGAIACVAGGRVVATVVLHDGLAVLPADDHYDSLGVYRVEDVEASADPLAAIEARVRLLRPAQRPWTVCDAEIADGALRALAESLRTTGGPVLAVRLRPNRSCRSIRDRLRTLGIEVAVVDAGTVLDEGAALDVSASFDAVRLERVAARLRRLGFVLAVVLHRDGESRPAPAIASALAGNLVEIEIDNPTARAWLLREIDSCARSLHLQTYIAIDDGFGRRVEEGLAAAAARGVVVRVLVDSLHGLHGSFGTHNPLLDRLSSRPGIELRTTRPITEVPSWFDLKQRDHRKLAVFDGRVALLGGRNLAREYYTGFAEVPLTPEVSWRELPWLDAGARVRGPAVRALDAAFLEAWLEAGGSAFALTSPEHAGSAVARVIVHRGLRDANALEAYRELIDGARSHVCMVHGFPLVLELQHALLAALRRGVRVKVLFGRLTPTHGGAAFEGAWATLRFAATELVHSRIDPLVAAGAEAYLFALRDLPSWAPDLGLVHPHVHAKLLTADGLRCAVGSANMDITAAYWESELMLVVEDGEVTRAIERELDAVMTRSLRIDPADPEWQRLARRRAWMRRWPGLLSA